MSKASESYHLFLSSEKLLLLLQEAMSQKGGPYMTTPPLL